MVYGSNGTGCLCRIQYQRRIINEFAFPFGEVDILSLIHIYGEEDKDIEVIINSYELITEYLCMKMFDYGVLCVKE